MVNTRTQAATGTSTPAEDGSPAPHNGSPSSQTEWRPNTAINTASITVPEPPEFAGELYQDPEVFCEEFKKYAEATQLPEASWSRTATKQPQGKALAWYNSGYQRCQFTWAEFRHRLTQNFNRLEAILDATEQLFTGKQEKVPASCFIWHQEQIAKRIYPDLTVERLIPLITRGLNENIRNNMPRVEPQTIQDLMDIAESVERRWKNPPSQNPRSATPAKSNSEEPRPPPFCRYCPGRYWHKDCPTLQQRYQGNANRAGDQTRPNQQ